MWLLKSTRIALLLAGAFGFVEFSRRAQDRPGELQAVERESAALNPESVLPDSIGQRISIAALPPAPPPQPSAADEGPKPSQIVRASVVPPELSVARSSVVPSRLLALDEMDTWNSGRAHFDREWTVSQGLGGPGFNAESCGTCHNAPCTGGAGGNEFNVVHIQGNPRYGKLIGPGNQLTQMRELRKQLAKKGKQRIAFAEIQTPSLLGLGAIDTISDSVILSREDPNDYDGDGIKGVARRLVVGGGEEIGRFGWKAQTPRLSDFVCLALGGELGLTVPSTGTPGGERGFGLTTDDDKVADPEIPLEDFEALTFFIAHIAQPERGGSADRNLVSNGQRFFDWAGCAACHVPALMGKDGLVNLYSDLLLHEVLAAPEGNAKHPGMRTLSGEAPEPKGFRTPPLWGVGKTAPYMHDGRSEGLREAILAHDLEAAASRDRFSGMEEADQLALIAFLEDL